MLKHRYPQSEPKYMHKVHTVAEFRHLCYESWRFRIAYASKSEERTRRKKHTVNRTESPSNLYLRCDKSYSGYRLDIEGINRQQGTDEHRGDSDNQTFRTVPCKMDMYIMCQYEVS